MENELSFNFKDYLSQIQANNNESDPNENNEENEFLINILSGMNFTPPYQNYIENTINKIINDYIQVKELFNEKNIVKEQIYERFKNKVEEIKDNINNQKKYFHQSFELKKNVNNNNKLDNKTNINDKKMEICNISFVENINNRNNLDENLNENINANIEKENKLSSNENNNIILPDRDIQENNIINEEKKGINLSSELKEKNKNMSLNDSKNENKSKYPVNNKSKDYSIKSDGSSIKDKNYSNYSYLNDKNSGYQIDSSLNKEKSRKTNNNQSFDMGKELVFFENSFNLNGDMYELFCKSIIFLTLKCYEVKDNDNFHFYYNIKHNLKNIDNVNNIELDFLINNLDIKILKSFILYFADNILFLNFNEKSFEIVKPNKDINNNTKNNTITEVLSEIKELNKIDVIGEIGISSWNDQQKVAQFSKYCKLMNLLKEKKNVRTIKSLNEKIEFNENNGKLIMFVTDSPFMDIYKDLEQSKLIKSMKGEKNVNSLLLFLSMGLNEKAMLNKLIKKNKVTDAMLLRKIESSNNKIIDAEQFKKACLILNEFITNIKQIIPSNADIIKNKLKENIKNLNLMLKSNISLITFQPKYFDNYFFDKIKTDELDIHIIYFSSKKLKKI